MAIHKIKTAPPNKYNKTEPSIFCDLNQDFLILNTKPMQYLGDQLLLIFTCVVVQWDHYTKPWEGTQQKYGFLYYFGVEVAKGFLSNSQDTLNGLVLYSIKKNGCHDKQKWQAVPQLNLY